MLLKDLLELLDPMTQLRIVCYDVGYYYATPIRFWQEPDFHPDDLDRTVGRIDPGIRDRKPFLMVGLETEEHIKYQKRMIDQKFRPGDWVERCPDFHADKDGNMVPDWETD